MQASRGGLLCVVDADWDPGAIRMFGPVLGGTISSYVCWVGYSIDRRFAVAHVKEGSTRWMYSGARPNRVATLLNRGTAAVVAAGIGPKRLVRLEVRGRRSRRRLSFPVVIADYEGQRYLVAMLGEEANWVRNVRAAAGKAALRHGRREDVILEEIDPSMRAPILRRYLEVAPGGRAHVPVNQDAPLEQFEQIAEQYPVFRIRAG